MTKWVEKIRTMKWYVKSIAILIVVGGLYLGYELLDSNTKTITYQTAVVEKGTLVTSIAATGSISSGNTTNVSTKASGTVKKVYVKNGDRVTKGQKLIEITLDSDGIERRSAAWQAYLQAKENLATAQKAKSDTSIQIWKDKQAILDAEEVVSHVENLVDLTDAEKYQKEEAVTQAKLAFEVNATKLANADSNISAAKINLQAAFLDYQDVSGTIVAPATGIINNITLTEGSTLVASTSQSTSTGNTYASSQTIGFVRAANNEYLAKVSLTEVDVTKVTAGQKVTLTMDAHAGKTFTGKVLAVDVSGNSSSGVTSYPATIQMDATELPIYPNMSVSANIITKTITDVLLVPVSAVTTNNGISTIQVIKNGVPTTITIEVGETDDTKIVVKSGLTEGEEVVIGNNNSAKNNNSSSAFSSNRSGSTSSRGGGNIMMMERGF